MFGRSVLGRTSVGMSDIERIRDRATVLYALALEARDNNLDNYAAQLEELRQRRLRTPIG